MIPKDLPTYYRLHSKFYDLTRWTFLFGRYSLPKYFPNLESASRILDLGCGTGEHLDHLRKKYPDAEIIGLDLSTDMLCFVNREITKTIEIRNEYYTLDTFPEDEFDLILCSYSLSMMQNLEEVLESIIFHLKKNGMLLVVDFDSTPFSWFTKWMKKNHVHFDSNLFELLEKHFDVEYLITRNAWFGLYTYSTYLGSKK